MAPDKAHTVTWLTGEQTARLPQGTAVSIDDGTHRGPRLVGRLHRGVDGALTVRRGTSERTVTVSEIKRTRVLASVYEDGDPVLRIGIPASQWRGGVVRTDGHRVLVETADGFEWFDEADIEPAERRPALAPRARRGPVPATAGRL